MGRLVKKYINAKELLGVPLILHETYFQRNTLRVGTKTIRRNLKNDYHYHVSDAEYHEGIQKYD